MKHLFFLTLLATTCLCDLAQTAIKLSSSGSLHVLIDPGHGGIDTGAVRGHLKESEIALKVSLALADLLKRDTRFKVSLTRMKDEKVSLSQRTDIADEKAIDVLVSIHLNSSTDTRARGQEFYFQNQLPVDEDAMYLASRENEDREQNSDGKKSPAHHQEPVKSDLRHILEDLQRNERVFASSELSRILYETWLKEGPSKPMGSRAIRQAPFHVVSQVTSPSVLVELGFLSHPVEGPRLGQPSYQAELAESLYQGLIRYKEMVDKDHAEKLRSLNAL